MNKLGNFFKPLTWFTALVLAGLLAGCGGDDGNGVLPVPPTPPGSAAGAVCTAGADCVDLLTAGEFAILAQTAISNTPTSAITGDVGLPAGASITGLGCTEVSVGRVIDGDAGFTDAACLTTDGTRITQAVADSIIAFGDANTRAVDFPGNGVSITTADCAGAVPGVYGFPGATEITQNCTLTGTATDVWIFQITGTFSQTAGTTVTLAGGALPQNVFWQTDANVVLGAGAHLEGIVLAATTIVPDTGASVNGRLIAGTAVTLDGNTVTRPE